MASSATVCFRTATTTNIVANYSDPTSTNLWDVNIMLSPVVKLGGDSAPINVRYNGRTGQLEFPITPPAQPCVVEGVICSRNGTNPSFGPATWPAFSAVTTVIKDSTDTFDPIRVVAYGFEVTNTTPTMFEGGSVVYWSSPAGMQSDNGAMAWTDVGNNSPVTVFQPPPATISEAINLVGSVQCAASEGAYIVGRLESTLNPASISRPVSILFAGNAENAVSTDYDFTNGLNRGTRAVYSNMSWSGAYFTGLSPETSLQVTVHTYYEQMPTMTYSPILVPLATPACCYDPTAIELYARAMCELPFGVPVGENPAGEFWKRILGILSTALPTVGRALTPVLGPIAGLAGGGLGLMAGEAANRISVTAAPTTMNKKTKSRNKQRKNAIANGLNLAANSYTPSGKKSSFVRSGATQTSG
jgi:hypothetical protein